MLIFPVIALILIGGSYFFASRSLPPKAVMRTTGFMALAAFLAYYLGGFVVGVIVGAIMRVLRLPLTGGYLVLMIALSLVMAVGAATLVLQAAMRKHRREKAVKAEQQEMFG